MPRVYQPPATIIVDERAELTLEPGQHADLVPHLLHIQVKTIGGDDPRRFYELVDKEALILTHVSASSPDINIHFDAPGAYNDAEKHQVIGGPWATVPNIVQRDCVVPARTAFALGVRNRSRETIKAVVYMRFSIKRWGDL